MVMLLWREFEAAVPRVFVDTALSKAWLPLVERAGVVAIVFSQGGVGFGERCVSATASQARRGWQRDKQVRGEIPLDRWGAVKYRAKDDGGYDIN